MYMQHMCVIHKHMCRGNADITVSHIIHYYYYNCIRVAKQYNIYLSIYLSIYMHILGTIQRRALRILYKLGRRIIVSISSLMHSLGW